MSLVKTKDCFLKQPRLDAQHRPLRVRLELDGAAETAVKKPSWQRPGLIPLHGHPLVLQSVAHDLPEDFGLAFGDAEVLRQSGKQGLVVSSLAAGVDHRPGETLVQGK